MSDALIVVGGGLAGAEAAWQAAERGADVTLYEMRPTRTTPAHQTDLLAELVCSNSLKSAAPDTASGLLKEEMDTLGSLVLGCARETAVPAGTALAVDREAFARRVTESISAHPRITLMREEVRRLPDSLAIIATGPLTSDALAAELAQVTGRKHLYFFDALSPTFAADSLNLDVIFEGSRRDEGEGDYLNCPLTEEQYDRFYQALVTAERVRLRPFEEGAYFEACLPVEEIARRGRLSLAFGPMRPVGLVDLRTGKRPFAVVQLRPENRERTMFSPVGFQTSLMYPEQERVFRLIPGLENAQFLRHGQIHRNTYLNAPVVLDESLRLRARPHLFCAGQLVGVEGYVESCLTGLLCGINAARTLQGHEPVLPPPETMSGALLRYLRETSPKDFQPMNANYGLLPALETADGKPLKGSKQDRRLAHRTRSLAAMQAFLDCLVPYSRLQP